MSFVAPIWLAAAAAVAIGLVVAHLFSTSVPPRDFLPTVRFVPEGAPLAVMRTRRLSDVALLLLRLLAVALLGCALAGAHVPRDGPPRVVILDASRAVGAFAEVRDSARAVATDGTLLIVFDATARRITADTLAAMEANEAPGSLSAALVAAHRAIAGVSRARERTELVIVSPVVKEEVDSATARLLELWAGPVRHVRVATAAAPGQPGVAVRAVGDDPVAAVVPVAARNARADVRIVRTAPTRADSLWARDSGGVLVAWPADLGASALTPRSTPDAANGIASGRHVVVATFARTHEPGAGRAVVRWIDGAPAASESPLGNGCVRNVAIPVDPVGDVALRESFGGVLRALTEPCGGARDFAADSVILRHAVPKDLLSATDQQILRSAQDDSALDDRARVIGMWLAAIALALLVAEQFLRTRARAVA